MDTRKMLDVIEAAIRYELAFRNREDEILSNAVCTLDREPTAADMAGMIPEARRVLRAAWALGNDTTRTPEAISDELVDAVDALVAARPGMRPERRRQGRRVSDRRAATAAAVAG